MIPKLLAATVIAGSLTAGLAAPASGGVGRGHKPPPACVAAIRDFQQFREDVVTFITTAAEKYQGLIETALDSDGTQTAELAVLAKETQATTTVKTVTNAVDAVMPKAKRAESRCLAGK